MQSKTSSLLINYVSVPELLSCLIPDIGLALLAGILKEDGHRTKIIDYSTLDTIKRFVPSESLRNDFHEIVGDLETYFQESAFVDIDTLNKFNLTKYQDLLAREKDEKDREINKIIDEIDIEVCEIQPNFIGFKLWAGECFSETIQIAEEIKRRHPDIIITGGGPQVDWSMEHIYDVTDVFDILSFGDGDESIVEIAEYCMGIRVIDDIRNILYKKNGEIRFTESKMVMDLNKLPYPDYSYETYPALKGNQKLKVFMLEESRGCPISCNFCVHPIKSGNSWREKDPQRIVDEMQNIIENHHSRYFRFSGSNTPMKLQIDIAKKIIDCSIEVRYSSFGQINTYKNCNYEIMGKAGCKSILFGLESGSVKIQKEVMNKVVDVNNAQKIINDCRKNGINTVLSVIYPSPKETEETKQETLDFIQKVMPNGVFICLPFIVPRTNWFTNAEDYNIDIPSKNEHIKFMMNYHVRYNGHPILWNFGLHKINNLDFREQGIACGQFVNEIKKIGGISTQITEEEILFSSITGDNYTDFALEYQRIRNNYDMNALEELVSNVNERACSIKDDV